MDESFVVRFQSAGRRLNITRFDPAFGVVFDTHPDASPLNMALGFQPRFPLLLDPVRRRHDWRKGEFKLKVDRVGSDALQFSGYEGDRLGLPQGVYDITIEVESYDFENSAQTITLQDGGRAEITLNERRERRQFAGSAITDPILARVTADGSRSRLDDQTVSAWLGGTARPCRKACLLNILAKLRAARPASPAAPDPLASFLEFVYFADVDRIYAAARPQLNSALDQLVTEKRWVKEGRPRAAIHRNLLYSLSRFNIDANQLENLPLTSYRQGGRNCLQIVTATPPGSDTVYADIDIDLGNPLWDLEGLIVHLSEVLDSGRTNHFSLHDKLDDESKQFLYYDLIETTGSPPAIA